MEEEEEASAAAMAAECLFASSASIYSSLAPLAPAAWKGKRNEVEE